MGDSTLEGGDPNDPAMCAERDIDGLTDALTKEVLGSRRLTSTYETFLEAVSNTTAKNGEDLEHHIAKALLQHDAISFVKNFVYWKRIEEQTKTTACIPFIEGVTKQELESSRRKYSNSLRERISEAKLALIHDRTVIDLAQPEHFREVQIGGDHHEKDEMLPVGPCPRTGQARAAGKGGYESNVFKLSGACSTSSLTPLGNEQKLKIRQSLHINDEILAVLLSIPTIGHLRTHQAEEEEGKLREEEEYLRARMLMNHLRGIFKALHPSHAQEGGFCAKFDEFSEKDHETELGHRVVMSRSLPAACEYLKSGCPLSLRIRLWGLALGLEFHEERRIARHRQVTPLGAEQIADLENDLLCESLIVSVLASASENDGDFFPFAEAINSAACSLFRESAVILTTQTSPSMDSGLRDAFITTCGDYRLLGPLAYISTLPEQGLGVARVLLEEFWLPMRNISSSSSSILHLCLLYITLVKRYQALVDHLLVLGLHPLEIALPWLQSGFAGFLPIGEVLQLWDRIIGYRSLTLLPILAVSIISFREKSIRRANRKEEVLELMNRLDHMKVVPLLQKFLFCGHGPS